MIRHVTTNDECIPKLACQCVQGDGRKVRYQKGSNYTKPLIGLLAAAAPATDDEDKDGV
jgi:hypothetical protein